MINDTYVQVKEKIERLFPDVDLSRLEEKLQKKTANEREAFTDCLFELMEYTPDREVIRSLDELAAIGHISQYYAQIISVAANTSSGPFTANLVRKIIENPRIAGTFVDETYKISYKYREMTHKFEDQSTLKNVIETYAADPEQLSKILKRIEMIHSSWKRYRRHDMLTDADLLKRIATPLKLTRDPAKAFQLYDAISLNSRDNNNKLLGIISGTKILDFPSPVLGSILFSLRYHSEIMQDLGTLFCSESMSKLVGNLPITISPNIATNAGHICKINSQSAQDYLNLLVDYQQPPEMVEQLANGIYYFASSMKSNIPDLFEMLKEYDGAAKAEIATGMGYIANMIENVESTLGYCRNYRNAIKLFRLISDWPRGREGAGKLFLHTFIGLSLHDFPDHVSYEFRRHFIHNKSGLAIVEGNEDFLSQQQPEVIFPLFDILVSTDTKYHPQIKGLSEADKLDLTLAYSIARDNTDDETGVDYLGDFYYGMEKTLEDRPDDLGRWAASIVSDFRTKTEGGLLRNVNQ